MARILAGLQLGAVESLVFSYYSVSFKKYTANLKTLGMFDEKEAERAKGYLFSTNNIGNFVGISLAISMNLHRHFIMQAL